MPKTFATEIWRCFLRPGFGERDRFLAAIRHQNINRSNAELVKVPPRILADGHLHSNEWTLSSHVRSNDWRFRIKSALHESSRHALTEVGQRASRVGKRVPARPGHESRKYPRGFSLSVFLTGYACAVGIAGAHVRDAVRAGIQFSLFRSDGRAHQPWGRGDLPGPRRLYLGKYGKRNLPLRRRPL